MRTYNCLNCNTEQVWTYSKSNKYCSNKCQTEYQYKSRVSKWLTEGKDWSGMIPNWVRRHLKESHGDKCSSCNIVEWNGKAIGLEIDHIDGNPKNNLFDNLRLMCPNCHSQTDTFKNKKRLV